MRSYFAIILACSFYGSYAQQSKTESNVIPGQEVITSILPGKWLLVKRTEPGNEKPVTFSPKQKTIIEFFKDGKYLVIFPDAVTGDPLKRAGKWEISGKTIRFYENKWVPDDEISLIIEHFDKIVKVTPKEFVVDIHDLNPPSKLTSTDYYKKL